MTLFEALEIVSMRDLMTQLGFREVSKGRTSCLICGSTSRTCFSFRDYGFHCFRCDAKGGKLYLIEQTLHLDRRDAIRWLAATFNLEIGQDMSRAERQAWVERRQQDERDQREAEFWKYGAQCFWEWILDELPEVVPERYIPTQELLRLKAAKDAPALLALYREYRERFPRFTAAQVHAGELALGRLHGRVARFIVAGMEVPNAD